MSGLAHAGGRSPSTCNPPGGLLTAEELLVMVEPVQWIVEAVIHRELQLVEAQNGLTGTLRPQRRPGGCCSGACGGAHVGREEDLVDAPVEETGHPRSHTRSGDRPRQRWKPRPGWQQREDGLRGGAREPWWKRGRRVREGNAVDGHACGDGRRVGGGPGWC
jgi:hypothetical protein